VYTFDFDVARLDSDGKDEVVMELFEFVGRECPSVIAVAVADVDGNGVDDLVMIFWTTDSGDHQPTVRPGSSTPAYAETFFPIRSSPLPNAWIESATAIDGRRQ